MNQIYIALESFTEIGTPSTVCAFRVAQHSLTKFNLTTKK
jgi:hypothetical protein